MTTRIVPVVVWHRVTMYKPISLSMIVISTANHAAVASGAWDCFNACGDDTDKTCFGITSNLRHTKNSHNQLRLRLVYIYLGTRFCGHNTYLKIRLVRYGSTKSLRITTSQRGETMKQYTHAWLALKAIKRLKLNT